MEGERHGRAMIALASDIFGLGITWFAIVIGFLAIVVGLIALIRAWVKKDR